MVKKAIEILVCLVITGLLAALLFPMFAQSKGRRPRSACLSNLKQAGNGLRLYLSDNDDRFPDAGIWMDQVSTYVRINPFKCDAVKVGTGYAFNDALSRALLPKEPERVAMVYDSTKLGRNEHDKVESMPHPGRHKSGNYVLYADISARFVRTPP